MEKTFKDVAKKDISMLAEYYGKIAGLIPFYTDNNEFVFITKDQYNDHKFNQTEINMKSSDEDLFCVSWNKDQDKITVVADAFIDYIHGSGFGQTPEDSEKVVMAFVTEHVAIAETLVSSVFRQLNEKLIQESKPSKLVLPTQMN